MISLELMKKPTAKNSGKTAVSVEDFLIDHCKCVNEESLMIEEDTFSDKQLL